MIPIFLTVSFIAVFTAYNLQTWFLGGSDPAAAQPVVKLDLADVTGVAEGSVHKFLGIPFATAPTGDLRFRLPVAVPPYSGAINATEFGPACPQQSLKPPSTEGLPEVTANFLDRLFQPTPIPIDEDCLSINVVKPKSTLHTSKLPVVVWIHGGGFISGGALFFNGTSLVERSIALGEPMIYVSINYRLSAFGFLPGKEVKTAGVGNLGLHDQRTALKWIQKYISAFEGDPQKVTIWGQSAGAISVAYHMLINDGDTEGLFRGAFLQSGAHYPVGNLEDGQKYYDALVMETHCTGAKDTLKCLRGLPYNTLDEAVDKFPSLFEYNVVALPFMPRADGLLFSDLPQRLVEMKKMAKVPVVVGSCDDEGTMFALSQRNVTTNEDVEHLIRAIMSDATSDEDISVLRDLYSQSLSEGSPFDTGDNNAITPQFKRLSAFQGDFTFQSPRRFFSAAISGQQDVYAYIYKRSKDLPVLGSFHGADLMFSAYPPDAGDFQDALVHFVTSLDPNGPGNVDARFTWPKWTVESPQMVSFNDGEMPLSIIEDTYRKEEMETISKVCSRNPLD